MHRVSQDDKSISTTFVLICGKCRTSIAGRPLEHVALDAVHPAGVKWADQDCPCPAGQALVSIRRYSQQKEDSSEQEGEVWIDPNELSPNLGYVEGRRIGCCGMDGCDGPNRTCETCETAVGTERSDCWTPRLFVVDETTTLWVPADQVGQEKHVTETVGGSDHSFQFSPSVEEHQFSSVPRRKKEQKIGTVVEMSSHRSSNSSAASTPKAPSWEETKNETPMVSMKEYQRQQNAKRPWLESKNPRHVDPTSPKGKKELKREDTEGIKVAKDAPKPKAANTKANNTPAAKTAPKKTKAVAVNFMELAAKNKNFGPRRQQGGGFGGSAPRRNENNDAEQVVPQDVDFPDLE